MYILAKHENKQISLWLPLLYKYFIENVRTYTINNLVLFVEIVQSFRRTKTLFWLQCLCVFRSILVVTWYSHWPQEYTAVLWMNYLFFFRTKLLFTWYAHWPQEYHASLWLYCLCLCDNIVGVSWIWHQINLIFTLTTTVVVYSFLVYHTVEYVENKMSNITNVTLACDDDRQTGDHKVIEHSSHTIEMAHESKSLVDFFTETIN